MHWTGSERSPHSRRHNMMSSLYGLELVVDKGCPDERITAIPVVDIVFEIGKALKHVLYVRGGGGHGLPWQGCTLQDQSSFASC